jgi:integrase
MARVSTRLLEVAGVEPGSRAITTEPGSRVKLTKRVVERASPAGNRDVWLWDKEMPGFGLRIKSSGVRSYIVQYRNTGGRTRRLALGRHGILTPEQARETARQRLAEAKRGSDPSADRHAVRKSCTVDQLCERYLREHAEPHKKASSVAEDRRLIKRRVRPTLGKMKADAITQDDVMRVHHSLRATPYEANRMLALLSKVFNLAEAWKVRPRHSNPCEHVKRYAERKRERFLSREELSRLGGVLAEAERTRTERPGVIAALKLLAFTGCRRGEVLALRWDYVDLEAGEVHLPDAKAGERTVTLGAPALALLAELPRVGPFVVTGVEADQPLKPSTLEEAWWRICERARIVDAKGEPSARLHDLRHTVGTYGGQSGLNAFMVRDLLGHKTLAMTSRYVERDTKPLRAAADQVSEKIAAAMSGKPDPSARWSA